MINTTMQDIHLTFRRKRYCVAGGWQADVPFAVADEAAVERYAVAYQRERGLTLIHARAQAREGFQAFVEQAAREKITDRVEYWAAKYLKIYGDLDGFDPAIVAREWVPGPQLVSGPGGDKYMRGLLVRMRET